MAGFASGMLEGLQASQQMQMQNLLQAEGQQKITMNEQQIELTKRELSRQDTMLAALHERMKKLNSGDAGQPVTQADYLAQLSEAASEANFMAGRTEEATSDAKTASTLRANAAYMKEVDAKERATMANYTSNLMDWVLNAPDDNEGQQRWKQSQMLFQNEFGKKSNFANQPYDKRVVQGLKEMTISAEKKALEDQRKAQQSNIDSEMKYRAAETRKAEADTKLAETRRAALEKAGGSSKKEKDTQALREDTVNDIDDLITQIEADPDVVGLKGHVSAWSETAKTITGLGSQETPANTFSTSMRSLLTKLPKALTGTSRSAKDEREQVAIIADLSRAGTTGTIAINKLNKLKAILQAAQEGKSIQSGPIEREPPKAGAVVDGYKFKGGDPSDSSNWEKVSGGK